MNIEEYCDRMQENVANIKRDIKGGFYTVALEEINEIENELAHLRLDINFELKSLD